MRISDWSSDVCSSDLRARPRQFRAELGLVGRRAAVAAEPPGLVDHRDARGPPAADRAVGSRDLVAEVAERLAGVELPLVRRQRRVVLRINAGDLPEGAAEQRSEEHKPELPTIMHNSLAV